MDNDFATGYALGSDSNGGNCNNGGFWGGDGWWAIIIFAMIFGWGRGGFGKGTALAGTSNAGRSVLSPVSQNTIFLTSISAYDKLKGNKKSENRKIGRAHV